MYLRSNDRLLTATQILVGSWIESQYIATSQLKDEAQTEANKVSFQKLLDQSFASKKLIDILKDYEKEKELKSVIDGIKELDKLYSGLHTEKDMTKAELEKSLAKLKDIRSKIVN
jgi:seryl-tRNA synthetase